ncbi:MAG TPA: SDR family oxidoreductase [Hyphomicrobiaceae bacterium]|nr:SDR family oxidoreductase [Hyphomicrobiaceae bacterium]
MHVLLIGHGYVGSYLAPLLTAAGHSVVICDENAGALAGLRNAVCCRYQHLTVGDVGQFDVILWFAGHSNVPRSIADPAGAVANNCIDLLQLAQRKSPATRLIYASTASVYSIMPGSVFEGIPAALREEQAVLNPVNPYDCSKISFDSLAHCFAENVVGLRLGTVCGYAPRLRGELIFNAMNRAAIEQGCVWTSNRGSWRSILFLDDLAHYVLRLLDVTGPLPRILNTGSMNIAIGDLADAVAAHYGVNVITKPDGPTYSFQMDCRRIRTLIGPPRAADLSRRCEEFAAAYPAVAARTAS